MSLSNIQRVQHFQMRIKSRPLIFLLYALVLNQYPFVTVILMFRNFHTYYFSVKSKSISDNRNHILELIRSLPTECNPSDFDAFSGQVNQITSVSDLIPGSNPLKRVLQLIIKMHVQNGANLIKDLIKKNRYGLK